MKKAILMIAAVLFGFAVTYLACSFVMLDFFWVTKAPSEGRALFLMVAILPVMLSCALVDINVRD